MKSTQQDQDGRDTRNRPCLCEASVDSRETRLAHYDGFARALPLGGGRSGPNYQLLRAFHEHHQHHHECVLSLAAAAVSVLPLLFQQHLFPSRPPGQACLRLLRESWPARAASLPAAHLVYLDSQQQLKRHQEQLFWQQLQRIRHDDPAVVLAAPASMRAPCGV